MIGSTGLAQHELTSIVRMPVAGLLTWLVPGLGHIYLGDRVRGLVLLVAISATFWSGVAIGGVQGTVAPHSRKLWFMAELCSGGNTVAAYGLHYYVNPESARSPKPVFAGHWASAEVGVHYAGVAGLLNLLVMFDAIARAEPAFVTRRGKRQHPGEPP